MLLSASHGRLIARGHPAIHGKIEQRGEGILEIGAEPAAVVRLVVDIVPAEQVLRYPEAINPSVTLCGVELAALGFGAGWRRVRFGARGFRPASTIRGNLTQRAVISLANFAAPHKMASPCVRKESASKPGLEFATVFNA